ncbi:structural maintenance of chromosome 2 [Nematocida ausubeli]|nr:structural maintenance of chromosome 2 [Nematocida ausubeli]KAI5149296.1 structural maintenance of chromosome 2 [Nematocida ausubeli]
MFLESIEAEGFKSYGAHTVISPIDKSFTAITGLNGTGKSNILDAICFVLGVDTPRLLRSASIKDLIFKQAKRTSGSAKVSLIFNNKEKEKGPMGYAEIDIIKLTRIITEDGKTKYLLNDHNVSTKTVTRLLQCVGLSSSKAGYNPNGVRVEKQAPYFIVMQGRVSRILSMKSAQFLTLLEECAGTSVYRTEKYKASSTLEKKEKKLLETKETLSKTIFPFLERLRRERDEYYAHKEATEKRQILQDTLVRCKEAIQYKEAESAIEERERIIVRLSEIEREIEEKTKEIVDVDVVDVDIASIQERIDNRKREITRMMIDQQEEERHAAHRIIERKEKEIRQILKGCEDTIKNLNIERMVSTEETENSEKTEEPEKEGKSAQTKIETLLARLEDKERAFLQADRQKDSLEKERKREMLSTEVEKIQRNLEIAQEGIEAAQKKGLTEELSAHRISLHKKCPVRPLDVIRREVERIKRELGYPIRDGVYGKVKELLEVVDPAYEISVGVVIGGRKEYLVVENEEIGRKVIDELSREGRRIDVIPLNKIITRRIEPKKEDRARAYGSIPLIEAITYPQEIKKAMEYLLGGYILAKNRKTAVDLRDKESISSVTLEGELFDRRGTITGGSLDTSKYKFEKTKRKEELLLLEKEEEQVRKTLKECTLQELNESTEFLKLTSLKKTLSDRISQVKAEIEVLGRECVRKDEIKSISESIQILTEVKNKIDLRYTERDRTSEKLKEIEEALKVSKEKEAKLQEEIKRDESDKLNGIKNNEVNRARRSIQIKERKRIEMDVDLIKKEKIKHEMRYKKIEHVTPMNRKNKSKKTKEELELEYAQAEEELNFIKSIPRKEINKKNIEILEKNEEIEMELKERIKKLQNDKKIIEETLLKLNQEETLTIQEIFKSVNLRIGKYLKYFIPNSDAKLEAVNGSVMNGVELHVKIGTWKKGLTELSGGQRSLCALSLIFALLKTKPSPLYILDEIDAALDASHTEAMGRMIQNEFIGSQFIVVSLKDGMYHNANVLFQTFIREGTSGVRRM